MQFISLAVITVLVIIDQLIKNAVVSNMAELQQVPVIYGLLDITYVKNYGAAFSLLNRHTALLIVITAAVLGAGVYLLLSGRLRGRWLLTGATLVLAGGIGNLIDRVRLGYVIDYLDVRPLFDFAIFNFADCCVVVGTIICAIYLIFIEPKHAADEKEKGETDGEADA